MMLNDYENNGIEDVKLGPMENPVAQPFPL